MAIGDCKQERTHANETLMAAYLLYKKQLCTPAIPSNHSLSPSPTISNLFP